MRITSFYVNNLQSLQNTKCVIMCHNNNKETEIWVFASFPSRGGGDIVDATIPSREEHFHLEIELKM